MTTYHITSHSFLNDSFFCGGSKNEIILTWIYDFAISLGITGRDPKMFVLLPFLLSLGGGGIVYSAFLNNL